MQEGIVVQQEDTNLVDHVKRCMGIEAVTCAVQEHRKAAAASKDGKVAPHAQSSTLNSMCMANEQDMLLHCMSLLVTVFNLAIDLFKNPEFLIAIVMDSTTMVAVTMASIPPEMTWKG